MPKEFHALLWGGALCAGTVILLKEATGWSLGVAMLVGLLPGGILGCAFSTALKKRLS
jgi:hypothetical protein